MGLLWASAKVCAGRGPSEEDDGLCQADLEGRIGSLDHCVDQVLAARLCRLMLDGWLSVCAVQVERR